MVLSVKLDDCTFLSESFSASTFKMEKTSFLATVENEIVESKVYGDILTLLTNKIVRIGRPTLAKNNNVVFDVRIENGNFADIANLEFKFSKLLSLEQSLFTAFIRSAQLFSDSLAISRHAYSTAYSLLVYSVENIANLEYDNPRTKRKKIVKFVVSNVIDNRFEEHEIRQLDFKDKKGNKDILFKKLLDRSYILRCKYVHEAKMLPPTSEMADKLSMAFVSNDQKTLFPSYLWLRRVIYLALNNFLKNQTSNETNHISSYTREYRVDTFKAKKAIKKGEFIDENSVYLQQLDKEFVEEEYLNK